MLLRNMHIARGQANGTRMLICKIHSRIIEAKIVTGRSMGKVVFIPPINSNPTDISLPFKFRRRQFPLRPAFAMTINKARPRAWPDFTCPLVPFLMVNIVWPKLGSGLNVLCKWLLSVARSTEKKSMSRTLFTRSCCCGHACEKTMMHVKSHDQMVQNLSISFLLSYT